MHIRRKYRMRNSIEVCEFNSAKVPGVNRIEGAEFMIKDYWRKFGGVYFQYLQDKRDEGEDIGEYIAKSPITCDRVAETSWSHSRNIKKVEGEDTIISGHAMTDKPRVPKGWYLDKDSCYEGTNVDGYPYRTYTIRRIKKQRIDHKMPVRKVKAIENTRKRKRNGRTDKADHKPDRK